MENRDIIRQAHLAPAPATRLLESHYPELSALLNELAMVITLDHDTTTILVQTDRHRQRLLDSFTALRETKQRLQTLIEQMMERMLIQDQMGGGGGAHLLSRFNLNDYYYVPAQHLGGDELGEDDNGEQRHITIPFRIRDEVTGEDYRDCFQPQGHAGIHGPAIPTAWIDWLHGEHNKRRGQLLNEADIDIGPFDNTSISY